MYSMMKKGAPSGALSLLAASTSGTGTAGDRYLRCPADDPARTQARHAKELAGSAAADGFDGELRFLPGLSGQPTAEGAGIEIHVVHSRVPGAASVMAF